MVLVLDTRSLGRSANKKVSLRKKDKHKHQISSVRSNGRLPRTTGDWRQWEWETLTPDKTWLATQPVSFPMKCVRILVESRGYRCDKQPVYRGPPVDGHRG